MTETVINKAKAVRLIVFDVDGVLVPRGTKIKQVGNITKLETKVIAKKEVLLVDTQEFLSLCH